MKRRKRCDYCGDLTKSSELKAYTICGCGQKEYACKQCRKR